MDKASAYGAGDCRFESCRGHLVLPTCSFLLTGVGGWCAPRHQCPDVRRHRVSLVVSRSIAVGHKAQGQRDRYRTTNNNSTPRGFEPLRAEPNGFLVHHLNHSVTVSRRVLRHEYSPKHTHICMQHHTAMCGGASAMTAREPHKRSVCRLNADGGMH